MLQAEFWSKVPWKIHNLSLGREVCPLTGGWQHYLKLPFREGVGIGASFPCVGPDAGLGGTGRLRWTLARRSSGLRSAFRSFGPRRLPSQLRGAKRRRRRRPCLRASARACRHPLGRSRRPGSRKRKGSAARPGRRRRGAEWRAAERAAVSVGRRAVLHLRRSIPPPPGGRGPLRAGWIDRGGREIRRVLPGTPASLRLRGPRCRCGRAVHSFRGRWCGAAERIP